jgi:hypothetical protein
LKALTEQLDNLRKVKNRPRYIGSQEWMRWKSVEADVEETQWEHLTRGIIGAAFGDPSPQLDDFYTARASGGSSLKPQFNFESRVKEYDALLRSLINVLRLQLPQQEIKGVYEPGEEYDFYRDLSSLFAATTQEIFIIDAYLDEKIFDLYVEKVPASAKVRILSNKIGGKVETVAKMYANGRPLELRTTADVHDRMVFFDQRGWLIGQSIKDAARKKPTYLVELGEPLLSGARDIYNRIWAAATAINLGP